jgi:hypothetical protein
MDMPLLLIKASPGFFSPDRLHTLKLVASLYPVRFLALCIAVWNFDTVTTPLLSTAPKYPHVCTIKASNRFFSFFMKLHSSLWRPFLSIRWHYSVSQYATAPQLLHVYLSSAGELHWGLNSTFSSIVYFVTCLTRSVQEHVALQATSPKPMFCQIS